MSGAAAQVTPAATETSEQALTRAQAAAQAKRFGEAAGICNDVLAAAPDNAPALALLGMIAAHTNDPERGITLLERAVTLRPGVASWYANLSALYRMVYRMQDALRVGQEAIRLDPQNADHLVNLSLVFTDVDDREHAIACLLRALGLRPDHADGHLALGQNLLAMGDFEPGWKEYEWRNLTEAGKGTLPKMTSAAWNGMRIPNGRLLMVGDQGYGDTIQFARYIPLIADRCQELIMGCSAEMGPLLATIPGVKQYLPSLDRCARPRRALPAVQCAPPGAHHAGNHPGRGALPVRRSCPHRRMAPETGCHAAAPAYDASVWPGPVGRRIPTTAGARYRWPALHRSPPPVAPASSRCRSRCRRPTCRRWRSFRGLSICPPSWPISAKRRR